MMEGSSLRIIVGTYSALGTLEEMSCKGEKRCNSMRRRHKSLDRSTEAIKLCPVQLFPGVTQGSS